MSIASLSLAVSVRKQQFVGLIIFSIFIFLLIIILLSSPNEKIVRVVEIVISYILSLQTFQG